MTTRFVDRVVLVTGGGSGIGRETALAFAREGAAVVVSGRNADALAQTEKIGRDEGLEVGAAVADVTVPDEVERLVAVVVQRHGGLHVAVNNAGMLGDGPVSELDEDFFDTVVRTNLTGTWLSMKHEIRHMREHGGGAVVNIASVIGPHLTIPGAGLYGATKAAITALSRAAAVENIAAGVRINCVCPAAVDTTMSFEPGETVAERDARLGPLIPVGRVGSVAEVAAATMWLASDESSFTVGHDLVLDGGVTV